MALVIAKWLMIERLMGFVFFDRDGRLSMQNKYNDFILPLLSEVAD